MNFADSGPSDAEIMRRIQRTRRFHTSNVRLRVEFTNPALRRSGERSPRLVAYSRYRSSEPAVQASKIVRAINDDDSCRIVRWFTETSKLIWFDQPNWPEDTDCRQRAACAFKTHTSPVHFVTLYTIDEQEGFAFRPADMTIFARVSRLHSAARSRSCPSTR